MRQIQFIFIATLCLFQLFFTLHSSIVTYMEQQYHNFSELGGGEWLARAYQAVVLSDNALYAHAQRFSERLESLRREVFAFDSNNGDEEELESSAPFNPAPSLDSQTPAKPPKPTALDSKDSTDFTQSQGAESVESRAQDLEQDLDSHSPSALTEPSVFPPVRDSKPKAPQDITPKPTDSAPPAESSPPKKPAKNITLDSQNKHPTQSPPKEPKPAPNAPTPESIHNPTIPLEAGREVLLIGDSMMQGIAPPLQKALKKQGVRATNLSKHSTGLTYKHYFNWQAATIEALEKNPNIALVIVLLGANDPWSMKKNIAFQSPQWEAIYTARIEEILNAARERGARVVWYEVPYVRDNALNAKIAYLNRLYERVVGEKGEYFLHSNGIITQGGRYSSFIKNAQGKSVLVRSDDGVHFSSAGYRIMGNILLQNLKVVGDIKGDSKGDSQKDSAEDRGEESSADSKSTSGGVYLHRDKNEIARSADLEASSGWGIVKGEGATSQFKPLPLNKKENTESNEVGKTPKVKAGDSEKLDSESKRWTEFTKTGDSEKVDLESERAISADSKTMDCHADKSARNDDRLDFKKPAESAIVGDSEKQDLESDRPESAIDLESQKEKGADSKKDFAEEAGGELNGDFHGDTSADFQASLESSGALDSIARDLKADIESRKTFQSDSHKTLETQGLAKLDTQAHHTKSQARADSKDISALESALESRANIQATSQVDFQAQSHIKSHAQADSKRTEEAR